MSSIPEKRSEFDKNIDAPPSLENMGVTKNNALFIANSTGIITTAIGIGVASQLEDKKMQWAVVLGISLLNLIFIDKLKSHTNNKLTNFPNDSSISR